MGACVVLALLAAAQIPQPAATRPPQLAAVSYPAMYDDARLADVCFVDNQRGWAVGDRGTIWHTANGGKQWRRQPSGVSCPLRSVWFIDAQTGWAVGGFSHPYTHSSSGVLLRTNDGGRHWRHDENLLLPALRQIRFFDSQHGWALGCRSSMFPSGAFTTDNGGHRWKPIAGGKSSGWLAGDFLDPHTGALAGRSGRVAAVRRTSLEQTRNGNLGLRALRTLKLVAPVYGWLAAFTACASSTISTVGQWVSWEPSWAAKMVGKVGADSDLAELGPQCWPSSVRKETYPWSCSPDCAETRAI